MFKKLAYVFRIRREERVTAAVAAVVFTFFNVLHVCAHWRQFSVVQSSYDGDFFNGYILSGFDPNTYWILSDWFPVYNVFRHSLLAFFMYPFYLVNQVLIWLTGVNFATVVTASLLTFCATYSMVFLRRITLDIANKGRGILCALYLSFGYTLVSGFAPDHFVISQFLLLLTLWLCGEKLNNGAMFNVWQTLILFFLTAGVTLSNGAKIFFAAFATRRKRFFWPGYLLLAVAIPCALMWYIPRKEFYLLRWPDQQKSAQNTVADEEPETTDSAPAITPEAQNGEDTEDEQSAAKRLFHRVFAGFDQSLMYVYDAAPRTDAAIHNFFGEALQLHADYALGDINGDTRSCENRPVIVKYSGAWAVVNYTVEAAIVLLFLAGVWCGRRSRFLWTAMSFFLFDMVLHFGLGFGINEVYIMSAHYLFVLPIATAYLLKRYEDNRKVRRILTGLVGVLALWCFVWNSAIIIPFLCG